MPATTITGMNTVILPSDSGWDPEQVLATITSAVSRAGGAEPTSVTIPIGVLPVASRTVAGITTRPTATVFLANGTWAPRSTTSIVGVLVLGGGGGGAFGGTYTPGSGSGGGGGGAGGGDYRTFFVENLTSTVAVTVGAGGASGQSGITPPGGGTAGQGARGGQGGGLGEAAGGGVNAHPGGGI